MYSFPCWNQSVFPCPILTVASWPAYRFLRRQVRWSGIPLLKNFPQFVVIYTIKRFGIVSEAEDVFLELLCFLYDPTDVANLICGFSAFSKSSLYIWKFLVYVLLKPTIKDFEHNLAIHWNECNCMVIWTFFGIAFLWDWNGSWPFPLLWPLLNFSNLLAYWMQYFNSIIFYALKQFNWIPSPPLPLFIVMLPKAHLSSHSRISSSMWVTTQSWLSGSLRTFLYSSVYSCHHFLISSASVRFVLFCPLLCPSLHEMFPWYLQFSWRYL